jgi:integrase
MDLSLCIFSAGSAQAGPAKAASSRPNRKAAKLGLDLMENANDETTELRRFKTYRDGLMIGLLASRQLRLRNLAGLTLDRTLVQRGDGWWIQILAAETKTKNAIELPWPDILVPHLDTYLADHRSVIAELRGTGTASDALWLSMYGSPMTDNGIYDRIVARTRKELGQAINPHLFRDCAATSIAIDDPMHVGIASQLLGHRTRSTTERYYNQTRSVEASHLLQNYLVALRCDCLVAIDRGPKTQRLLS